MKTYKKLCTSQHSMPIQQYIYVIYTGLPAVIKFCPAHSISHKSFLLNKVTFKNFFLTHHHIERRYIYSIYIYINQSINQSIKIFFPHKLFTKNMSRMKLNTRKSTNHALC